MRFFLRWIDMLIVLCHKSYARCVSLLHMCGSPMLPRAKGAFLLSIIIPIIVPMFIIPILYKLLPNKIVVYSNSK